MTAPVELKSERLLLRSFEVPDIPEIVRLAGAREVAATTLRIPHPYREADAHEFLRDASQSLEKGEGVVFAITIAQTRELCGGIGLQLEASHARAELGYWIAVPFWGRGYCTEAAKRVAGYGFDELRLHRIFAQTFSGNAASRRVLEKLGMRQEGTLRQHVQKWGALVDVDCYGVLREEFGDPHRGHGATQRK
jgi:RimJ/RimL family protein N-acetyltransferase